MMTKYLRAPAGRLLLAFAFALPFAAFAAPQLVVPFQGPLPKLQKAKPFHSEGSRIHFNLEQLRNLVPGQEVELTLAGGARHAIVLDLSEDKGDGVTTWVGHYKDVTPVLRTIITTGPGGTFGTIATPDNEYTIMPGPGDGSDWLVDMKAEKPFLPPIDLHNDARPIPRPATKSAVEPQSSAVPDTVELVPGVNTPVIAKSAAAVATPSPGVVVDILMTYTNGFASSLVSYTGNANAVQTRLQQLITSANTIFADSGVAVTLRMVGSVQVTYSDTARDTLGALADITPGVNLASTDPQYDSYGVAPAFANIETLRSQYGADMVTLLRDGYTNGGDGVAWVPQSAVGPSWASYMYSAMTGCTMSCDWVWVHEIGHNFGSAHDRATNAWENGGTNVPGSFSYSYGYYSCQGGRLALTCAAFSGACTAGAEPDCNTSAGTTNNFSDVMAYFQPSTTKNMVFSNPALLTCKGALGQTAACGSAVGNSDEANAALTLNNNRVAMSQIKATVVPLTTPSTTVVTSSLNPSITAQSVTLTATVSGTAGAATGSLDFRLNGAGISGCTGIALVTGVATCTTSSLPVGNDAITAAYAGSTTYAASVSPILTQVVNAKGTPTVAVSSSGNYVAVGTGVTFTASLSGTAGALAGTVTFTDTTAGTTLCPSVAVASNVATCAAGSLAIGDHAVSAAYSGSATYNAGTGSFVQTMLNTPRAGTTNVGLATAGASVIASSYLNGGFAPAGVINGDRAGANWTNGGGWADGTIGSYPDWIQVNFGATRSIDSVAVYTVQDNWQAPVDPSDTLTFSSFGIQDFTVQGWNGTQWVTLATVTNNTRVKRRVAFSPFTTDRIRVSVTRALNSLSRITEIEAFGIPATAPAQWNVALASSGAVASASSMYSAGFAPAGAIDGDHKGLNWSNGGGWADGTLDAYPDWLQVDFAGAATIDHVVVYTVQDNWQSPVEPSDTATFSLYGLRDFSVQGWDGTQWVTLGTVTGNTLVKRTVTFSPFTTGHVRIVVTSALSSLARVAEIEAWGTPAGPSGTNVAAASAGAVASASSQYSSDYPVAKVNDSERAGWNWSAGGGWADATWDGYPDWVQVNFSGTRTINAVTVYTLQDNWQAPLEPTDNMTFSQYGIRDFTVQSWNGSAWVTLATVTGNSNVKRTVSFAPVATDRIRVNVTNATTGLSRITEIEAWGN